MSNEPRIIFENKFAVSLTSHGNFRVEAVNNASLMDLVEFRKDINRHFFKRLIEQPPKVVTKFPETKVSTPLPADALVEIDEAESVQFSVVTDVSDGSISEAIIEIGPDAEGRLIATRNGEAWKDATQDRLVRSMYQYIRDLETGIASIEGLTRNLDVLLNGEANAAPSPSLCDLVSQCQFARGDGAPLLQRLQFNALSAAQAERLFLLMEERAESIQACAKILRHGDESYNPNNPALGSNREQLEREEGDGMAAMNLLCLAHDLNVRKMSEHSIRKTEHVKQYLHHQPKDKAR